MDPIPMQIRKWLLLPLGLLILLSVLMVGGWILTESIVQATSGQAFCSACHSMRPFAETHALDIHGGNNPKGLAAACADCHLPHQGPAGYLLAKARTGIQDVWAELITLFREPDWIANLERRGDYVYDSGCRVCHSRLAEAANQQPTAALAHQAYFSGQAAMQCVTCHVHVGHKDLLKHLSAAPAEPVATASEPGSQARGDGQEPSR